MSGTAENFDHLSVDLCDFLSRYAGELRQLASLASDLDHHIGEAVSASRSGNRGREMIELRLEAQGVDLLRQSLEQLHNVLLQVVSQLPSGCRIDLSQMIGTINLRDLADRLAERRSENLDDTATLAVSGSKGNIHLF
jgi:hypothetical protein